MDVETPQLPDPSNKASALVVGVAENLNIPSSRQFCSRRPHHYVHHGLPRVVLPCDVKHISEGLEEGDVQFVLIHLDL